MKAIEIISVPVSDQDRSKQFYLDFGLELMTDQEFNHGQRWIQLGFPGGGPSITLVDWFPKMPAGSLQAIVVETEDLEADVQRLAEKNVPVGKIDRTPWGRFATVTDPDGNTISLHEA